MKIKLVLFIVLSGILIFGCNKDKLPKGFPSEKEFAKILADVHFAEATLNQVRVKNRGVDSTFNKYYHFVLNKYKLSQEKFDTIVNWYVAHPEIYQDVYDESIAILSEREAEWQREVKLIEEEEERIRKEKEARNIWKEKKSYFISSRDTFNRQIPFNINVDTIENQNGFKFSAFYQFLKGNKVKQPKIEVVATYADSSYDTIQYNLLVTHSNIQAEITIDSVGEQEILNLKGFLVKHDTLKEIRLRIKNIEFEYLPIEDSVLVSEDGALLE